jgi:predicted RNA-binding Zn ribbon-like protein
VPQPGAGRHSYPSSPGPIPSTVSDHLCIDFVNSQFKDHTGGRRVYDRLDRAEWQRWFLERGGFTSRRPPEALLYRELLELRQLLRRLLESGREPDDQAMVELNHYLSRPSQSWELAKGESGFHLKLWWSDEDWRAVMAVVAASYARLLIGGGIDRVRVCANPDCSWIFFDDSHSGSRRWCDVAICGNMLRVRRHRERNRSRHQGG